MSDMFVIAVKSMEILPEIHHTTYVFMLVLFQQRAHGLRAELLYATNFNCVTIIK